MNILLLPDRLNRIIENENKNGSEAYTILEFFEDLKEGIFSELSSGDPITTYRRNLQRTYIENLERLMKLENNEYEHTDIKALARGSLKSLQNELNSASNTDLMTQYHVDDLKERIKLILDPS